MQSITHILTEAYETQNVSMRSLMLLSGMNLEQTSKALHVSIESLRRWERSGKPNPTASKLLAILAGYIPWANWRGWEMHGSTLFAPGQRRNGMTSAMIENMIIQIQLKELYEEENQQLRSELEKYRHSQKAPVLQLVK